MRRENGDGIVSCSSFISIVVIKERIDEEGIGTTEGRLELVSRWDQGSDFKINEAELPSAFHSGYNIKWIAVKKKFLMFAKDLPKILSKIMKRII